MRVRTEDIYEALFDDAALARLPDILAKAAGGRSAFLNWHHSSGLTEVVASSSTSPTWFEEYVPFAEYDPYLALALKPQNLNRVLLCNEWIGPRSFQSSIIYNDLIRRHGDDTVYCTGTAFRSPWGGGSVGVHRGKNHRPFEPDDARRLEKVIVPVERVLRARGEILSAKRAAALAKSALDAVGLAIITVGNHGRILQTNAVAEDVLRRADGLTAKGGYLLSKDRDAGRKLSGAIAAATAKTNPAAGALTLSGGTAEPVYILTVTPLVRGGGNSAALVIFRDPYRPDHSLASRLRDLFNLSRTEAAVAIDLAGGLSVAEIARVRRVSVDTLRSQLKSIHAKTGCHRQSQFVALLRKLPPLA